MSGSSVSVCGQGVTWSTATFRISRSPGRSGGVLGKYCGVNVSTIIHRRRQRALLPERPELEAVEGSLAFKGNLQ